MRSFVRPFAAALAISALVIAHPSAADDNIAPNYPQGVVGEGAVTSGEPDARTGAMNQSVPILLPPARGLPQPSLSVRYNSTWRDREAGYGWGLDLPVIERKPLSGFPEFDAGGAPLGEERYTFGGNLLVRICELPSCPSEPNTSGHPAWANGGGWWYYRLQVDGSSTRFYRSADRHTWRVLLPGGERLEFGRLLEDGADVEDVPAYEESEIGNRGVVRWRLAAKKDPQHPKNVIVYRWRHATVAREPLKLTDIFYTPPASGTPAASEFAHHVQVDWEQLPYPMPTYVSTERATLPLRLKRIAVASKPWDAAGDPTRRIVRAYNLRYYDARTESVYNPATTGPLWHHSFLREIQVQGGCRDGVESSGAIPATYSCPSLPAMRFEYSPGFFEVYAPSHSTLLAAPPNAQNDQKVFPYPSDTAIVDFNRDGLPDVVQGWQSGSVEQCNFTTLPDDRHTRIEIDAEGEPQLWCHEARIDQGDKSTPSDDVVEDFEDHPMRNSRPILGYLNRGASGSSVKIEFQCMDSLAVGLLNGAGTDAFKHKARFFNGQGSTVLAAAGSAPVFWQHESYFPVVARPITLPSFPPGSEPPNLGLGGCALDGSFDKAQFFPRWSWEPEIDFAASNHEYVRRNVNVAPGSSTWDPHSNAEPGWFVDVDGDGFADKLTEDTVAAWDLYHARVYFTRYYGRSPAPPLGASGAGVGPALVPFAEERMPQGALVPARRVRSGVPNGPPTHPTRFWYTDINGDGITDMVMAQTADGPVPRVRPGNGRGGFACEPNQAIGCTPDPGTPVPYYDVEAISSTTPWGLAAVSTDPFAFQFHDITGDGLADIVFVKDEKVYAWVNLDGKRFACLSNFADPCRIGTLSLPPGATDWLTATSRLTFADMNADGVDDIVVVFKSGIQVVRAYRDAVLDTTYAPNARAPRPGLLVRVHNGLGATTTITYRSTQELDAEATDSGVPWTFHSPAVDMVVTRVATQDTAYATTGVHLVAPYAIDRSVDYDYREPAYDRWKRQFVGFRSVASRVSGEQAITETTYWFGPCERDGVVARPLNGTAPTTTRCPKGSDDEFEESATFRSRIGKPVRVDRYLPDAVTQNGKRYLTSKRIVYAATNWLYSYELDHTVTATFVSEIETHHYDASLATSAGATDTVAPDADTIQRPPVQAGEKITRQTFDTLPETGEVHHAVDYGDATSGDMPAETSRYAAANENWQYLPGSVPVHFDADHSGGFATTARDNWLEYDATTGDLLAIEVDPGPEYGLDRFHQTGGATAPTPNHSGWWARLAEFHYDAATGVVDEVRGAPWTASPQSCTRLVLDSVYHQFPRQVIQFKNGCDSADPLVTDLAFDRGYGIAVAKTASDGGMSSVELDAFGRVSAVALPDPSSIAFTEAVKSVEYVDQSPLSYADVRTYTATFPSPVSIRRVAITNGLGEGVMSFSSDGAGAWIVGDWTEREGGGKVSRSRRPFSATQDPVVVAANAVNLGAAATGYFDTTYDGFGRAKELRENGELISERTFAPLRITVKDKEQIAGGAHVGASHSFVMNGRGQVRQTVDMTTGLFGGIATDIAYDGLGQPLTITKSHGSATPYTRTMIWDLLGRMVENAEPNTSTGSHHWRYAYDDAGHLVGTSDARGCGKNIGYDGLGRVTGEDYSPCLASQAEYSGDLDVEYAYDVYESGQVSPEPGFNDATHLAAGRLASLHDRGSHTRFNYDDRGRTRRVSRRVVKPAGFTATLGDAYSDHWLAQRADFDTADRVSWRTSGVDLPELLFGGDSAETYSYSPRGLVQSIGSSYGALIANIDYEADGQPTAIRYGDSMGAFAGTTAAFTYDIRRRASTYSVTRGTHWLWSASSAPPTYPLPDMRTTQTDLAHFVFHFDGVGNPTQIEDNADASQYLFDYAYPMKVRDMQYDDLYRVTSVAYGYGPSGTASFRSPYRAETLAGDTRPVPLQSLSTRVGQQTFSYDFLGNTTSTNDDLSANYDRSLGTIGHGEIGGPNQLRSANGITAKYDAAGNMIELKVQRQGSCPAGASSQCAQWFAYDWDEIGQLARARRWDFATTIPVLGAGELPSSAPQWDLHFAYSLGTRVLKSAKDSTGVERHTLDVFDTLRFDHVAFMGPVEDYDRDARLAHLSLGGGVGHIVFDPDLPYVDSPVHRFLNIGDHLGSAAITIDGESAELVERTTYQAFGALESDNRAARWSDHREDWKFTGKEEDIEVGLTYFGARYYAPHLGRWASADPLTIHGLGADLNPYAYVSGRVMRDVDPFGLSGFETVGTDYNAQPQNGLIGNMYRDWVAQGRPDYGASMDPGWGQELGLRTDMIDRGIEAIDRWANTPIGLPSGNHITPVVYWAGVVNNAADHVETAGTFASPLHAIAKGIDVARGTPGTPRIQVNGGAGDVSDKAALVMTILGATALGHAEGGGAAAVEGALPRGGTYLLRNPVTGQVMRTGRTIDLARRAAEHARDPALRDLAFEIGHRTDDYATRRGLEQLLHELHNPPLNKIRPISPTNPRGPDYIRAAKEFLGIP